MLTATVPYDNLTFEDVEFILTPLEDGSMTYVGTGTIRVAWPGMSCGYPIDIVVIVNRGENGDLELFIRDNRPTAFGNVPSGATSCPYHCPELRWGAAVDGPEIATCNTRSEAHMKRYADEQTLRNYVDRPASGPTPLFSGPAEGTDIDLVGLLER